MKIGVLSDIHDHLENLDKALDAFQSQKVSEIIFCGDFCSPVSAKRLASKFSNKIHCVFGNGDGDRFAINKMACSDYANLILYGEYGIINIKNRNIVITHYPFYAKALAKNGEYDAVFYGHNHISNVDLINNTLCANPGDIMGLINVASCGIYDSDSNIINIVKLI